MSQQGERALILGASSGFGAAAARAFAAAGFHVHGVHLDRRAGMERVAALERSLAAVAPSVHLYNTNAADASKMAAVVDHIATHGGKVRVVLHSLAFGSLVPLLPEAGADGSAPATARQLAMTTEVMANSLVYWVRALVERDLLADDARIFALTSSGSRAVLRHYGPVAAAKAALEAHVRQLAVELAPRGATVNAIMAGVTDTPALRKIPDYESLMARALARNPHGRLTMPDDVAKALVAMSHRDLSWVTGNVIRVDGGEDISA